MTLLYAMRELFTGVRGIEILRSSYPRSCIVPAQYP
jgi:hypothetical protein